MAEIVKALWLTDKNAVKVAPKTLTSQVLDNDGNTLDEILDSFAASVPSEAEFSSIILKSSTEGSSKRFKITIDDDGVLSITPLQ